MKVFRQWMPVMIIGVLVMLNSWWWAKTIPFDNAPDEYLHIKIPEFYVQRGRLPIFLKDQGMDLSCRANGVDCGITYSLYANYGYAINAFMMKFIPKSFVNEEYVRGRVASIFMAVAFAGLIWVVTKRVFPKDGMLDVAVTSVAVSVPMFTFVSSYINSDIAGLLSNIVVFWLCWELVNRENFNTRQLFSGGLALGFLALSRINQYPMFFLFAWSYALRWRRFSILPKRVFIELLILGGTAITMSGWWFVRNYLLYGGPTGNTQFWKLWWSYSTRQNPKQMGFSPFDLFIGNIYGNNWVWTSFRSLIGSFGYMTIWYPEKVYIWMAGLVGLSGVGIIKNIFRGRLKDVSWRFWFWAGVSGMSIVTIMLSAWTSWANEFQPQGRYWFAFYYPFVLALVYGVTNLLDNKNWKMVSAIFLILLFIGLNLWGRTLIGR